MRPPGVRAAPEHHGQGLSGIVAGRSSGVPKELIALAQDSVFRTGGGAALPRALLVPSNPALQQAGARTARARAPAGAVVTDKESAFVCGHPVARS